jgi:hypothetical protein
MSFTNYGTVTYDVNTVLTQALLTLMEDFQPKTEFEYFSN